MILGLSLPPAYLAGTVDDEWTSALGPPDVALDILCKHGVGAIELRTVQPASDIDAVLHAARRVWHHGLNLTVHGVLPANDAAPWAPALPAVLRAASQRGHTTVVTVHCCRDAQSSMTQLAERSANAVRGMLATADEQSVDVVIALEINRRKAGNDPGASFDTLLDVGSRIDDARVGFCWDFGHSAYNGDLTGCRGDPPAAFVERVVHTHIHDLSPSGQTHWPLASGRAPVGSWIDRLAAAGYDGLLNLELDPRRFSHALEPRHAVVESLRWLNAWSGQPQPDAMEGDDDEAA